MAAELPTGDAGQLRMVKIKAAGVDELDSLLGIGPVLAQRILDYRGENGAFTKIEDLTKVPGIGNKILENLYDYVTVG